MHRGERLINVTNMFNAFSNLLLQNINLAEQPTPDRGCVPHRQVCGQASPPSRHPQLVPLVSVLHP